MAFSTPILGRPLADADREPPRYAWLAFWRSGRYYLLSSVVLGLAAAGVGAIYGLLLTLLHVTPTSVVQGMQTRSPLALIAIGPLFETTIFAGVWGLSYFAPTRYRAALFWLTMVILGVVGHHGRGLWIVPAVFTFAVMAAQWLTWIVPLRFWHTFFGVFLTHATVNSVAVVLFWLLR